MAAPSTSTRRARPLRSIGRRLAIALPALAVIGMLFTGSAPNHPAAVPGAHAAGATTLAPTERHRKVARIVGEYMERWHYRQTVLDPKMSIQVFDRYLESLDGAHSYFLASDVAELGQYRDKLDAAIHSGNVEPAFVIFARFQERNREAVRAALADLDKEPDFTLDETFAFDRSKSPWLKNQSESDDLWRKRVKSDALSLMLANKTWPEAREVLKKRYDHVLKRIEQVTSDDVFENFMNAYAHVYDPHSNYLSPRSSEEYSIAMKLSYDGIGASLQIIDDQVTVMNLIEGGAAARGAQLKANDRITAVAQGKTGEMVDVVGWRLDDVVQLIRGPTASLVRLSVLPAGATPGAKESIVEIVRSKINLESQAAQMKVRTVKRGEQELKVGVIDVPSFYQDIEARVSGTRDYRSTTRDVARLIGELKKQKVDALVLDLRGDGGGLLQEATGLVGLFIHSGPVVQLREANGRIEVYPDPDPDSVWDGPLAVLVDRTSASASEIFSAAIQDYGRGLIIGQQTYGKGTVQNLYPLDRMALGPHAGFGELAVTIGKYYRVTGDSVQNRGVMPEVGLPSLISPTDVGESTRDSALPWDRIGAVEFDAQRVVGTDLGAITRNHEARMKSDPDLRALASEAAAFDALRGEKSTSLNLIARKAERERLDAERLGRLNVRRAAHGEAPLKSLEDVVPTQEPDANAAESAEIVVDLMQAGRGNPAQLSQASASQNKN